MKAIVFRVSSPGGQDTASEQISPPCARPRRPGKPVVVSMGEYGASGGYWISSEASAIVAEPTTLTGSIGVYGGKLAIGETAARYGVDIRQVTVGGPYAGAYSIGQEFTPEQRAAFAHQIDLVYAGFIQRVAAGRKLSPDRVRDHSAKGRVWTGAQAQALGSGGPARRLLRRGGQGQALAGLKGPVRLKKFRVRRLRLGAIGRVPRHRQGPRSARWRAMSAIASDPNAEGMIRQITDAKLRAEGADVLMTRPY
ncbi:MAG: S49 family peptidase [Caulobacteraceae bacterium]